MQLIPFACPGAPQVRCLFQTRQGGQSREPFAQGNISFDVGDDPKAVRANRKAIQQASGFASWHENKQVHGPAMVFNPQDDVCEGGGVVEADGLATDEPGKALVVKTADCQPLMLCNRQGTHVAGLHVGWRGNRLDFPVTGVAAFCERYGLSPVDLMAVRGPSLGPAKSEFTNFDQEWGGAFQDYYQAAAKTVDLWRMTRDQLVRAGLHPGNIFGLDLCTHSLAGLFFSYRRSKITGRQAAFIWIHA